MLRLIRPYGLNQLLTRHLSITAQQEKRIQFFLSDIGEGTKEVVIKEWFVTEGQQVEEFDELVEVQSDKATVPITSRYAGKIVKIHYDLEDTALVGKPLVDIEVEDADDEPIDHYESEPEEVKKPTVKKAVKSSGGSAKGKAKAKPAVRKFAKENGVDLNDVTGSGKNGIVTKDDVLAFMSQGQQASAPPPVFHPPTQQQAPPQPIQQTFKELPTRNIVSSGGSRREPLGPIAKAMTKSMNEANKIPHFGYKDEFDLTNLATLRQELKPMAAEFGIKLSYMPFIIKAVSLALNDHPILNASMSEDETELIYHEDHNIGVATDTPHGLLVPNIKAVQNLSVLEIAAELNRLHQAGLQNKLTPKDIKGGTFSLSNIGSIGGTYAKPVIVPPQVAIGAIGRIQRLPRFNENDEVVARHLTYISWSADHRCIEGAVMARFSNKMKAYLEQPAAMLLHTR
jgi:2-oxoisovalerate dehydrogenase E2 component (dihydrolipoyl transacylase)